MLESHVWNNGLATADYFDIVCGQITIHNDQWFGFIASGEPFDMVLFASNCALGDGLQIALMENCSGGDALACAAGTSGGASLPLQLYYTTLVPGKRYYLLVDGFTSDFCDYQIIVNSGIGKPQIGSDIIGKVWLDQKDNCLPDSTDLPAPNIKISKSGNYPIVIPTKNDGSFFFYQTESMPVVISVPSIPGGQWEVCSNSVIVPFDTISHPDTVSFVLKPIGQCPIPSVEFSTAPFLRPCTTIKLKVKFGNFGTVPAENMEVYVIIPSELEILQLPVNYPFTQHADTLVYSIGTLGPLEFKDLIFGVRPPCNNSLFGQTRCFESFLKISNACPDVALSHPKIKLLAECLGDSSVQFTLTNKGGAPTMQPFKYQVFKNDQLIASQTYILNNGESFTLSYPSAGETWRLESERDDTGARTKVFLEGCGGLTTGQANMFWQDDPNFDHAVECREIKGSFDPNGKYAFPTGAGPDHILAANTPIEYVIHFENTGTDTAFRVLLRDALPPNLNAMDFRPGGASHPFTWQLLGNILEVTFDPIVLPDTSTNMAEAGGWFQFFINQNPDLPNGATIRNAASIFFDYNAPILTDTVWHTIGRLSVQINEPAVGASSFWTVKGNPATSRCIFERSTPTSKTTRLELYHTDGRLAHVMEIAAGANGILERSNLPAGMYLFRMIESGAVTGAGKILFN